MSKRKLRLRRNSRPASISAVATLPANPGELCGFHPLCCEAEDQDCPGCGAAAVAAITVSGRRMPHCAEHEKAMRRVAKWITQLQAAGRWQWR